MILLDTNVISELMRTEPAQIVLNWFGQHDAADRRCQSKFLEQDGVIA